MNPVIDLARELGAAIQQDDRYLRMQIAQKAADDDQKLQSLIGEFNLKRMAVSEEMNKENSDQAKMDELSQTVRDLYQKIMDNESMKTYNATKPDFEQLMDAVVRIVTLSAQGEDPQSIPEHEESCGGDCGHCAGCH